MSQLISQAPNILPPPPPKLPLDHQDSPSRTSLQRPRFDPQNSSHGHHYRQNSQGSLKRPHFDPQNSHSGQSAHSSWRSSNEHPSIPLPQFTSFDVNPELTAPSGDDGYALASHSDSQSTQRILLPHQEQASVAPLNEEAQTSIAAKDWDPSSSRETSSGLPAATSPVHEGRPTSATDVSSNRHAASTPESHQTSNTSYKGSDDPPDQSRQDEESNDSFYWHSGRSSSDGDDEQSHGTTTITPDVSRKPDPEVSDHVARGLPARSTSLSPIATVSYGASALGLGGPSDWEYFGDYEAEEIDDEELYTHKPRAELPADQVPSVSDPGTQHADAEASRSTIIVNTSETGKNPALDTGGSLFPALTQPPPPNIADDGSILESKWSPSTTTPTTPHANSSRPLTVTSEPLPLDEHRPDLDDVIQAWSDAPHIGRPLATTSGNHTPGKFGSQDDHAEASLASTPGEDVLGLGTIPKNAPPIPKLPESIARATAAALSGINPPAINHLEEGQDAHVPVDGVLADNPNTQEVVSTMAPSGDSVTIKSSTVHPHKMSATGQSSASKVYEPSVRHAEDVECTTNDRLSDSVLSSSAPQGPSQDISPSTNATDHRPNAVASMRPKQSLVTSPSSEFARKRQMFELLPEKSSASSPTSRKLQKDYTSSHEPPPPSSALDAIEPRSPTSGNKEADLLKKATNVSAPVANAQRPSDQPEKATADAEVAERNQPSQPIISISALAEQGLSMTSPSSIGPSSLQPNDKESAFRENLDDEMVSSGVLGYKATKDPDQGSVDDAHSLNLKVVDQMRDSTKQQDQALQQHNQSDIERCEPHFNARSSLADSSALQTSTIIQDESGLNVDGDRVTPQSSIEATSTVPLSETRHPVTSVMKDDALQHVDLPAEEQPAQVSGGANADTELPSETRRFDDPYADLDPWGRSSLNRFAAMLREEARAETNQDKLNIFNVFTTRESRLRVILYGTDDELILQNPGKSTSGESPKRIPSQKAQHLAKTGSKKRSLPRKSPEKGQHTVKELPPLPPNRDSVAGIPVSKLTSSGVQNDAKLAAPAASISNAQIAPNPSLDGQQIPLSPTLMNMVRETDLPQDPANLDDSMLSNGATNASVLSPESRVQSRNQASDKSGEQEQTRPGQQRSGQEGSEVKNYLTNRRSIYRPFAAQTMESMENAINLVLEPEYVPEKPPNLPLEAPAGQSMTNSSAKERLNDNVEETEATARTETANQPLDLRRFIDADFDPLLMVLPQAEATLKDGVKLTSFQTSIDCIADDFSFIHASVVAWDTKVKQQREEHERQRHVRQIESEQRIDALFDEHEIGYGDIAELEGEFKKSEAVRKAEEDRAEYQAFLENVFNVVWTRLNYEIDQLGPHYEKYSALMNQTLAGKDMFEASPEDLVLAPAMTAFLGLHQKLEIRHQKAFEAVLERDRRLKKTEISPWYSLSNIPKVKQLEKQFEEAEKKAIIDYCQKRNQRANKLMDVLDENTLRGVGANQDYMEAIMKAVRRIASGRAFASMPGLETPVEGIELVQKARSCTAILASSSEQIVQTFHVADMLLNSADYEVSVAKAKVAKVDLATLSKLKEERNKEDQKLMRDLEHRLALIREDLRRTNDEVIKLMLFLGVQNGRAMDTQAAPAALGIQRQQRQQQQQQQQQQQSTAGMKDPTYEARKVQK